MNINKYILLTSFLLRIFSFSPALALDGDGTTGMNFLKIEPGPRQTGMGGASCGLCGDVYSSFYNPAGSGPLAQNEATFMHALWYEDISYDYASFACPVSGYGTFGTSVTILKHGEIQGYDTGGSKTALVPCYDLMVSLSASRMVSQYNRGNSGLFAGANLKLIQEKLDTVSSTTLALDMGCLYAPAWDVGGGSVRFGANLQNLGPKIRFLQTEGNLPLNLKLGAGYAREVPGGKLNLALDGNIPLERNFYFCAGAEYGYNDFIALRVGYNSDESLRGPFSCGLGIKGISGKVSFHIDHAFVPYDTFVSTHRVSLSVKF